MSAEGKELTPEQSKKATSIARQTMSPFCPGRTLSDCPSEYAAEWRRDIRTMIAEGKSAAEIQRELEGRVGNNLSGIPNRDSSYALPLGVAAGAALLLFAVFVRLRKKSDGGGAAGGGRDGTGDKSGGGAGGNGPTKPDGSSKKTPPPAVDDQRLNDELDVED